MWSKCELARENTLQNVSVYNPARFWSLNQTEHDVLWAEIGGFRLHIRSAMSARLFATSRQRTAGFQQGKLNTTVSNLLLTAVCYQHKDLHVVLGPPYISTKSGKHAAIEKVVTHLFLNMLCTRWCKQMKMRGCPATEWCYVGMTSQLQHRPGARTNLNLQLHTAIVEWSMTHGLRQAVMQYNMTVQPVTSTQTVIECNRTLQSLRLTRFVVENNTSLLPVRSMFM